MMKLLVRRCQLDVYLMLGFQFITLLLVADFEIGELFLEFRELGELRKTFLIHNEYIIQK